MEEDRQVEFEPNWRDEVLSFEDMGICPELLRGIYAYGYEKPSRVQRLTIVPLVRGRDVVVSSTTGSGMTSSISIGMLQKVSFTQRELGLAPQVLVITPTRETSTGTHQLIKTLSKYMGIKTTLVIGGVPISEDVLELSHGAHIVVGTPGRVLMHINNGHLQTEGMTTIVLDDLQDMLEMYTGGEVDELMGFIGKDTQVVFSLSEATVKEATIRFIEKTTNDPVRILHKVERTRYGGSHHRVNVETEENKFETLCDIIDTAPKIRKVIMVRSDDRAQRIRLDLGTRGLCVSGVDSETLEYIGETEQESDESKPEILVVTHQTARRIDLRAVPITINYDIPVTVEDYRYSAGGIVINFVMQSDEKTLSEVMKSFHLVIPELPAYFWEKP